MSLVLSQQIFQHNIVQHRVSQQPLQLGIPIRDYAQLCRVRHLHATVLSFELVKRPLAETVLTAYIRSRHPSFLLFNYPDYLDFGKTALSHLFAPLKGSANSTSK